MTLTINRVKNIVFPQKISKKLFFAQNQLNTRQTDTFERIATSKERENIIRIAKTLSDTIPNEAQIQKILELIEQGVNIEDALRIVYDSYLLSKYNKITAQSESANTIIEDKGSCIELEGRISPKEAANIVCMVKKLRPDVVQRFIDVKDIGVTEDIIAVKIAQNTRSYRRFMEITNSDSNSLTLVDSKGKETILERPFEAHEAVVLLRLPNENLKYIQELLKRGVDFSSAYAIAGNIKRAQKFLSYITPKEDGTITLKNQHLGEVTIPRALSVQEAMIAFREHLNVYGIMRKLNGDWLR